MYQDPALGSYDSPEAPLWRSAAALQLAGALVASTYAFAVVKFELADGAAALWAFRIAGVAELALGAALFVALGKRQRWAAWVGIARTTPSLLGALAVVWLAVRMAQSATGDYSGYANVLVLVAVGVASVLAAMELTALRSSWRALRDG